MDRDTYLIHLARDGARMAEIARGDLDAKVPTCPDWTLQDLIEHTGFVHRWQTAAVRDRPTTFPEEGTWRIPPTAGESWADWFQTGVDEAVRVMGTAERDEPRWTWFEPDQTAGWYHRRITQETVVHRIDAELAATGTGTRVDTALAVDGIDEMFDVFVPASPPEAIGGNGETVLLVPSDSDVRWTVTLHAERATSTRGGQAADAEVRGTASDLLLYVWGRDPLSSIEVAGERRVSDLFFAACRL